MPDAIAIRLAKRYVEAVDAAWDAACELNGHLCIHMGDETRRRARVLLYHLQMHPHLARLAHHDYDYEASARSVLDVLTGNEREPEPEGEQPEPAEGRGEAGAGTLPRGLPAGRRHAQDDHGTGEDRHADRH